MFSEFSNNTGILLFFFTHAEQGALSDLKEATTLMTKEFGHKHFYFLWPSVTNYSAIGVPENSTEIIPMQGKECYCPVLCSLTLNTWPSDT